jgi:hypothetical protein
MRVIRGLLVVDLPAKVEAHVGCAEVAVCCLLLLLPAAAAACRCCLLLPLQHGTHVAGTVGGATYGVAKRVNLVSRPCIW